MKLLIMDESRVKRRKIARAVESIGFHEIIEADNGEQAVQLFSETRPDVTCIDITMPQTDAIDAINRIKAEDSNALIVVVSSAATQELAGQAMAAGARERLEEPYDDDKVSRVIQGVVAKAVNETGVRPIPKFDF